jgi:hypothetical protein
MSYAEKERSRIRIVATIVSVVGFVHAGPALGEERICISVYRYGGGFSGWARGGEGVHAAGSFDAIDRHVTTANTVFAPVGIQWVWDVAPLGGAIEDIDDQFGLGNGDIMPGGGSGSQIPRTGGTREKERLRTRT